MNYRLVELLIFLGTTTTLILIMGGFIIFILFLHRRKQERDQIMMKQLKTNFENELLKAQIEIQEQTFEEISREIHDNVNLSLTLVKLKLNTLQFQSPNDLEQPIEIISKAINDLTDLSRSMNSEIIKECGLITALSMEVERIRKINQIDLIIQVTGNPVFLESKKELYLFRIFQEALNNILKHSFATSVHIDLEYTSDILSITIKDNGRGISNKLESNALSYPPLGLKSMLNRVKFLQGDLNIDSLPGEGTQLSLSLPILKSV